MRIANAWSDYEIIDSSRGEKLERWGDVLLVRPDPQIIWNTEHISPLWQKADARYIRSAAGGGEWEEYHMSKKQWTVHYKSLAFKVSPTGFKHTGLFPEQAVNWDYCAEKIKAARLADPKHPIKVLNLFAYTGGATLACAAAGAEVCHVDASKGMVSWARENSRLSGLEAKPIRWIVDDCQKFVERELRRGSFYDAVIMDPPSYGRGPGGEVWKLEEQIYDLVKLAAGVLSKNALFFMLSSYTTGLPTSVMEYLLGVTVGSGRAGEVSSSEIGLPVSESGYNLPCGSTAVWQSK
ncbi:MAG: class I SAM-dependent methyltransferase [Hydrogenoanaerobacterium sp.]